MFGPWIAEVLPYATMAQEPYPPPTITPTDDLSATTKASVREILSAPSFLSFLDSKQRNTLGSLPEEVRNTSAALIKYYVEEGIPDHNGPPWSSQALETAISKGIHTSACTPETTMFIQGEIHRRIKVGFIILLPAAGAVWLFGEKLKLSRIEVVNQAHRCLRLILKLPEKPDKGTPGVNHMTDREAEPEFLQFGRAFTRILQAVWEADSAYGSDQVFKLYVTNAYHHSTVTPLQVGTFAYIVPLITGYKGCIICINLVLLMWWMDSLKFVCTF